MMHAEDSNVSDGGLTGGPPTANDIDAGANDYDSLDANGAPSKSSVGIAQGPVTVTDKKNGESRTSPDGIDAFSLAELVEAEAVSSASDPQDVPKDDQPPSPMQSPQEESPSNNDIDPSVQQHSMEFNVALEALESMRRLNLEVEFSNASSTFPVDHEKCTYCQREALHRPKPADADGNVAKSGEGVTIGKVTFDGSRMRRFRGNVGSFFSKSSASVASTEGDTKSEATQSLASPSIKSLSSMESGELSTSNASMTNGRASRRNVLKRKPQPCLTCGHPTCSRHSSSSFSKNHIPICQPCAYLFELDFLVDIITSTASNPEQCRQKCNEIVDLYDRAKLLLEYTAQYADDIASSLEGHTARSNKIGVGSSATGIGSGVLGVVGCGALLVPPVAAAGVPLLIASLVFGGGATAAQTADASVKYFSEPNKLAEKMVALHGMVLSLLRITEVLSYGLLKSHLNVNYSVEGMAGEGEEEKDDEANQREALAKEISELLEKHGVTTTKSMGVMQSAVTGSIVATEVAVASRIVATEAATAGVAGAEAAVGTSAIASGASVVGRGSRYFGRVGTTAASSARFIPIAGGLLSAACVYVEGKELKRTVSNMREGNPCAKAEQVRSIRDELGMLPDSSLIADECRRVFDLAEAEKLRKANQMANDCDAKEGLKQVGPTVTMAEISQEDISDMIGCMETAAKVDVEDSTST